MTAASDAQRLTPPNQKHSNPADMKLIIPSPARLARTLHRSMSQGLLLGGLAVLAVTASLQAQATYTFIDLSAAGAYGAANAASGGQAAGFTATSPTQVPSRAALWTGDGLTDLHPTTLAGDSTTARSFISGFSGNLQVGTVFGPNTANRYAATAWNDTAASARLLTVPFAAFASQALATDGVQIVGYATGLNRDGTATGATHAVVWDVATGTGVDLGDAGNGAQALGVGGGIQAGYTFRSSGAVATIWRGSAKSQLVIHPKNAVVSLLYGTDGVRQVGIAGFDLKAPGETNKGGTTKRYNYASVWSGTDLSWINIHPYSFTQSYATAVKGSYIVGYAVPGTGVGSTATYHALVWDGALQVTDLNAYLPAGFTGAIASAVDENGNIAGSIYTPDGQRHAAFWMLNP